MGEGRPMMKNRTFFLFLITAVICLWGRLTIANEIYAVITWVSDGDTVVLEDGRRVRYIGINTPEVAHKDQKAEPYGYTAKTINKRLVLNKNVRLELDTERKDQYGRHLAYVFLGDGTFVNAKILEEGYGYFLYRRPNTKYALKLLAAQRKAMSAKRGIWHHWKEKEGPYLGNRRSRRFHRVTCPYGRRIGKSSRLIFNRAWDAFWEGYAPGKKCRAWTFDALR